MKIKQKASVQFNVNARCPTHSLARVSVRDIEFAIDEPEERGGTNLGPSPTETSIAALAGCTNTIGNKCAKKLGIDIGHLEIEVTVDFDRRGVLLMEEIDVPFTRIAINVVADGSATQEELETVATETAKFCPLSKIFKQAGSVVEENWQKKSS